MDATYITPFIESTKSVFSMMLQLSVTCGMPQRTGDGPSPRTDVSGIIGLSGDVVGNVVLAFPLATAQACVERFTGSPLEPGGDDFCDAIGELVNMVSGGAKAKFEGKDVRISVPSVIIGPGHTVQSISDAFCVRIPCRSELGEFSVEVAMKLSEADASAQVAATDAASRLAAGERS